MRLHRFLMVALLCLPAQLIFAQGGSSGTILGTVTDSSGALVPNARIVVINTLTGVPNQTQAGSAGQYTVPYLSPGTYRIEVQAPGFEKFVAQNVQLAVDKQVRVDAKLVPGAVTQSVQVLANPVALDTDTSSITQEITQNQVNDLPLNGRNFLDLLTISGLAVQTVTEASAFRQGAESGISINGERATSNDYTLDGMPNVDASEVQPAIVLSVDAIQEFAQQTETYGAQYGFSANQINLVTKSGTNRLSGSLYEFDRNNVFDAIGPFQTSLPPLRQNQFGYAVGGPVVIPHLYNGHNRTFWFASYEGWRINSSSQNFFFVPDPANLAGNFTQSITDPTTGSPFSGCTASGITYTSCIPQTRWSRLAQLATANHFWPTANTSNPLGNYVRQGNAPVDQNEQDYRIDQDLGRFGKVFGRGTYGTYIHTQSEGLTHLGDEQYNQHVESWAISHTKSFGSSVVNRAYFNKMNFSFIEGAATPMSSADFAAYGLQNAFSNATGLQAAWPGVGFVTGGLAGGGGPGNAYLANTQPEWDLGDSLTISRGRHTISAGIDYRNWKLDRNYNQNFFGDASFSGIVTGGTTPTVQNEIADFLLGYFYRFGNSYVPGPLSNTTTPGQAGNPTSLVFSYLAPYLEDDWKISDKLTINLGMRYDLRAAPHDGKNHFFWRDPKNAAGGECAADQSLIGTYGVGFYRYCGESHPPTPKEPFAPRIGFAYRISKPMVLRGGYGIFYDNFEGREFDNSQNLCPFSSTESIAQSAGQGSYLTTDDMFVKTSPTCSYSATNPITTYNLIPPVWHNAYVQQYSLSVERQLTPNTTIEIDYVGNRGTRLLSRNNIAQAFPAADPTACQANPSTAGCPVKQRRPYANYAGYIEDEFEGFSNYNGGTAKFEHRGRGFDLTAVYRFSRTLDDKSAAEEAGANFDGYQGYLNNHDPKADYGPSDFNVPQSLVMSGMYQLPIGRGKRFLGSANRAADFAIGGWQVNGIFNWQSGFPFTVHGADPLNVLDTFGAGNRADQISNPHPNGFHRSIQHWFDTSAFAQAPNYEFGTVGRNTLTFPTWNNLDLSLFKAFHFTERVQFVLRGEAFNALNHPEYGIFAGAANQGDSGFGGAQATGNYSNPAYFGKIITAQPGRIIQIGGKLEF